MLQCGSLHAKHDRMCTEWRGVSVQAQHLSLLSLSSLNKSGWLPATDSRCGGLADGVITETAGRTIEQSHLMRPTSPPTPFCASSPPQPLVQLPQHCHQSATVTWPVRLAQSGSACLCITQAGQPAALTSGTGLPAHGGDRYRSLKSQLDCDVL